MIQTPHETFQAAPVGRFCVIGTSFLWCASPSLAGAFLWASQSEAETRGILSVFDHGMRRLATPFDVILDTRGVESVAPVPLGVLVAWMVERAEELSRRVRLQACVIREGPIGLLLTGVMPVTGQARPYRIFTGLTGAREAFAAVAGGARDAGAELHAEVEDLAARLRGVPRELRVMRELLEARLDVTFEEVSRSLGMSPRSLQRVLGRHGTSFHEEVVATRLARAQALLRESELKLAEIGARVGISERALGLLFRAKTGLAPAEWRKQHKG